MKIPDITYSEVIELKEDINTVIENIELFYKENNLDIDISDISFYRFVIKRVIFSNIYQWLITKILVLK